MIFGDFLIEVLFLYVGSSATNVLSTVGAFDYTSESIHESIHAYSSRSITGVRSVEPMRNRFAGFTWGDANSQCQIWFT